MQPATHQILQAALALSEEERQELIVALLDSQATSEEPEPPFDPVWLSEIQRRSAEIDAGTVSSETWNVVRARVRRRLEGRSRG